MTQRPLAILLLLASLLAQAAPAIAQAGFPELRRRIESEASKPANQRLGALRQLNRYKTPQARRLLLELWKSETQQVIQVELLRLLGAHQERAVLDVLRHALLESGNTAVERAAAQALLAQGDTGITLLIKSLRDGSERVQLAAIDALGRAPESDKRVAAALAKALIETTGTRRERALAALRGHDKPARVLEELIAIARSGDDRAMQAEALRQLGLAGPSHSLVREAKAVLLEKARDPGTEKNAVLRGALLFALACVADSETLPALLALAINADAVLRRELAAIAREPAARDRLIKALAQATTREDTVERLTAVELLAAFETPEADAALIRALEDRSSAVVIAAIAPIARRAVKAAMPQLRKLFAGPHPELRLEAMLAMHALMKDDRSWPDQLLAQLSSTKIGLRCKAIDLLAELEWMPALGQVQALVAAPEFQVRSAAYGFLRRVRHKSSIGVLIGALAKESGRLEGEVLAALVELTERTYPAADYWKRWWDGAADTFELPKVAKASDDAGGGKPRNVKPAAITYYDIPVLTRRACFLVDVSGSMQQKAGTARYTKLYSAQQALQQVIKACEPEMHFNIVPFASRVDSWVRTLQPASPANKEEAKAFVRALKARGGTNVHAALETAFEDPTVDTIYLLSDGNPTQGEIVDIQALADAVRRWNFDRRIVIHTISFGADSALLRQLANDSGGTYRRYI